MAETVAPIKVNVSDLDAVKRVLRAADRLARRVENGDEALLEPSIREAWLDYRAIRQELRP